MWVQLDMRKTRSERPTLHEYNAYVLEVRVCILQSVCVSIVGCSPKEVIVPQGISPKPPTYDLWNLNQKRTLANPFKRYLRFPVATAVQCGRALSSLKTKSGPIAAWKGRTRGRITFLQQRFSVTETLLKT
ncbi:hypothetical protein TNCV_2078171 [Trichonephila clavipes]|nr:hypothetical protein TNCV_2078171 [Trichonephila clavipes]